MKTFIFSFLGTLLALLVVLLLAMGGISSKFNHKSKIDRHSYLVIDLYGPLPEYDDPGGAVSEILGSEGETLQRVLSNLEKARHDERIDGVIVKLSNASKVGAAAAEEIRDALKKVRETGKPVLGFADSIDPASYFLAAACDSIYAPPSAYVSFTGMSATFPFFSGTLEKLGVKPNIHQIKDYKAAAELVTRREMSSYARENLQWMIDENWDVYMQAMQEDRGLSEEQVTEVMGLAVLTAQDALEHGLFDRLLYWDQLVDELKLDNDEELRTVSSSRYAQVDPEKLGLNKGKKIIAVIHAHGLIGGRQSRVDPLLGSMIGHESVVQEIERARRDEKVAAIVFRVDSGGGDGLTSDLIGRAVERAAQDKPVVVSMVNVAASGGYMVAYRATRIVADPLTITGSIGSISGKFNLKGLYDKLGVTHDSVTKGPMALFNSELRDYTPAERARFEQNHWDDFNRWLEDVARRRGMSVEKARSLAEGREWTGRQAVDNGLVDELGGLDRAIELARELAEIPEKDEVKVLHYPEKQDFMDLLLSGGGNLTVGVRGVLYHTLHTELEETLRFLWSRRLYLAPSRGL